MTTLPILDVTALRTLYQIGGERLLRGMIDLFESDAGVRVTAALSGHAAGDLDRVSRAAHSLKSTAANLGAVRLCDLAKRLESAANASETGIVAELLPELADVYDQSAVELRLKRENIHEFQHRS